MGVRSVQELRPGQQEEELEKKFRLLGDPGRRRVGKRKAGWAPVPRKRTKEKLDFTTLHS